MFGLVILDLAMLRLLSSKIIIIYCVVWCIKNNYVFNLLIHVLIALVLLIPDYVLVIGSTNQVAQNEYPTK